MQKIVGLEACFEAVFCNIACGGIFAKNREAL